MCPICLRPRSSLEITRDYKQMREIERLRRRRPFVLAGYAALAAGAAWLFYLFHDPLISALSSVAASAKTRASNALDEESGMKSARAQAAAAAAPAPSPAPAPAPAAFPPPASPVAPVAPRPATPLQPSSAATSAAPARSARVGDLPIPALNSASQWAFYGRVYDLITLKPVAGVQLVFSGGGSAGTTTDPDGRFSVVLARLSEGSYEIRASHPDYASPVFYESDIPYAKLPPAERRQLARNAQDGDMTLPPLTDIAGEDSLRRDLFLAPRR
jgi:hypothetical protein